MIKFVAEPHTRTNPLQPTTKMYLPTGTLLQGGKYKIQRHISSGGFGNTYEAYDVSLDKRVAIKEFFVKGFCVRPAGSTTVTITVPAKRPLIDHLREKFVQEARAIARMEHENIVKVQNLFEENATAYYVMDYIEGQSLHALLARRHTLPEAEALPIIRKVAAALGYMHSQNRYHLDIKPANIMLRHDGKVILIDFGTSKQYAEVDGENTTTLTPCYTPGYAPPEQMNPAHTRYTAATDVYALGATLYKVLTGQTPPTSIMLMMGEATLPSLPTSISPSVKTCIERAIVPLRANRLQSIGEFLEILGEDKDVDFGELLIKAKAGNAEAQYKIGKCYYIGQDVMLNLIEAAKWWRKAAEQGHAIAQNNLGYCYFGGEGVEQDDAKAAMWWTKAAEQGDVYAQYNLGLCYLKGEGVPEDYNKAIKWFYHAADQDFADAQYKIGWCFNYGNGVEKDKTEAVKWWRKAAEQGMDRAQYMLGQCYKHSRGVAKNMAEAAKWYRKAAEQGHLYSQRFLAECYENGDGVIQDYAEAAKWWRKAAEQGDKYAIKALKRIKRKSWFGLFI